VELAQEETVTDMKDKPRKVLTVWINIYSGNVGGKLCYTKLNANRCASSGRIACVKVDIEYQEGEGL
jgi:hypothetical protein